MDMRDAEDKEVDNAFIKEYRKGRKWGLSLTDAIRSAEATARSRQKTLIEKRGCSK